MKLSSLSFPNERVEITWMTSHGWSHSQELKRKTLCSDTGKLKAIVRHDNFGDVVPLKERLAMAGCGTLSEALQMDNLGIPIGIVSDDQPPFSLTLENIHSHTLPWPFRKGGRKQGHFPVRGVLNAPMISFNLVGHRLLHSWPPYTVFNPS